MQRVARFTRYWQDDYIRKNEDVMVCLCGTHGIEENV